MAPKSTLIFLVFLAFPAVQAMLEGIYCGKENCYDVLGVTRDDERATITRNYRQLARKWHPDRHRGEEAKKVASETFQKIATAYEILKDEGSRSEYDYMLDNPEEMMMHYYYYFRRKAAPNVDVRLVVALTITVVSIVQYYGAYSNYTTAITYLTTVPKYRSQALDIAKKDGLLESRKKPGKKIDRDGAKEREETIIRKVIEEKMDIRGGYERPSVYRTLWLQLALSPYYLVLYVMWAARWIWKFWIKREEYGEEEKDYLIRKYMKMSQTQYDALEEGDRDYYMRRELWIKDNFNEWKEEQEEAMKVRMAESGRYKSYRRYMKNGGPGQMTFGPD